MLNNFLDCTLLKNLHFSVYLMGLGSPVEPEEKDVKKYLLFNFFFKEKLFFFLIFFFNKFSIKCIFTFFNLYTLNIFFFDKSVIRLKQLVSLIIFSI